MCIIDKQRIELCPQVEGMRGEMFTMSPIALNPDASAYLMNPFRHIVTGGHNARVFVYNRRPTEQEKTVKHRSESDMQRDAWYWGPARSIPPLGWLWRLRRSTCTLREPSDQDGNFHWWCRALQVVTPLDHSLQDGIFLLIVHVVALLCTWAFSRVEVDRAENPQTVVQVENAGYGEAACIGL